MPDIIVFTCASGKQCQSIIPHLYEDPKYNLRLIVHSKSSLDRLTEAYPRAEVIQAELGRSDDCAKIVLGATTIYYIGPGFHPHEVHFAANIIDAAVEEWKAHGSKLEHFVYSSVLHPEISKLLNHDRKRLIQEYLVESPLNFTILQPSHFADNNVGRLLQIKDDDPIVFLAGHDMNLAFSFTCLRDHGEASARVIRERSKHFFATYEIVSTLPMKYTELIRSVGEVLGKEIQIVHMKYEDTVSMYCDLVFAEPDRSDQRFRDGVDRLVLYYSKRGLLGNPTVLEGLIGRPATTLAQLAKLRLEG